MILVKSTLRNHNGSSVQVYSGYIQSEVESLDSSLFFTPRIELIAHNPGSGHGKLSNDSLILFNF